MSFMRQFWEWQMAITLYRVLHKIFGLLFCSILHETVCSEGLKSMDSWRTVNELARYHWVSTFIDHCVFFYSFHFLFKNLKLYLSFQYLIDENRGNGFMINRISPIFINCICCQSRWDARQPWSMYTHIAPTVSNSFCPLNYHHLTLNALKVNRWTAVRALQLSTVHAAASPFQSFKCGIKGLAIYFKSLRLFSEEARNRIHWFYFG